jgi:hypothetical protein
MKPFHSLILGTLVFSLLVSACAGATPAEIHNPEPTLGTLKPESTPPTSTPQISVIEPAPVDGNSSVPRELVEKAKMDLGERFDIDPDQISVAEARLVDWPDASLGCPQNDMLYAAVITPGYWILLEAQNKKYPYHTDQSGQIILCLANSSTSDGERPPLPIIPINPTEIKDGQPWMPVN